MYISRNPIYYRSLFYKLTYAWLDSTHSNRNEYKPKTLFPMVHSSNFNVDK